MSKFDVMLDMRLRLNGVTYELFAKEILTK